jgi:PhnB protein
MVYDPEIPAIQVHLCVRDGKAAVAWYERAFDAVETFEQMAEDGERVLHANLALFESEIMLHDEFPETSEDVLAPASRGGASMTVTVNLATPARVDAAFEKAVGAGAEPLMAPVDAFWGARYGRLRDPFGHVWAFSAPIKGN